MFIIKKLSRRIFNIKKKNYLYFFNNFKILQKKYHKIYNIKNYNKIIIMDSGKGDQFKFT